MEPVRVAVQATDTIMQAGLTSFLRSRPELVLVDRSELTEGDVLVVHIDRMTQHTVADLRGDAVTGQVSKVLIASELRENDILSAVECRVVAVLARAQTSGDRLVETIQSVVPGRGLLPTDLLGQLLDGVRRLQRDALVPRGPDSAGLTPREVDVLRLMAEGHDTVEIADKLCYSERTVKNVIYGLTNRLNLRNRPHAVAYAMRAGVI
ncbi:helix-turn-helix transcriptional regulator [Amycolatopsis regifaucium]|uniref:Helix-turn-helix transcriptional regulator n=2 Tax=Amycolatopsis regifaucium TaxID=546365 RepID=A0A154MWN1_9PSEU|nr:helix-turn-helix transcriptional regulator [Amycolatopsis regifaucium]OKA04543.1 helix-turn-helix transcriptional regulator [Amycolatopsis regifaucium]SFH50017.1 DNA-binding response regulator, NarL/FixJ family, contains REC and HTH domains [Amycolatopsis regifaucium]